MSFKPHGVNSRIPVNFRKASNASYRKLGYGTSNRIFPACVGLASEPAGSSPRMGRKRNATNSMFCCRFGDYKVSYKKVLKNAKKLIEKCCAIEPGQRPRMSQVYSSLQKLETLMKSVNKRKRDVVTNVQTRFFSADSSNESEVLSPLPNVEKCQY